MAEQSKQTGKNSGQSGEQLRRAFVFNLDLKSHPESIYSQVSQPRILQRSFNYRQWAGISGFLAGRWGSGSLLGRQVARRYSSFNNELGPLNRVMRFKQKPFNPDQGIETDYDTNTEYAGYSEPDFRSEPSPVARRFAPTQNQTTLSDRTVHSTPSTQLFEDAGGTETPAQLSPLTSAVNTFQPVVMRNMLAVEPARATLPVNNPAPPDLTRPDQLFQPLNPANAVAPGALLRTLQRLQNNLAENATPASADLHRPSLTYVQPRLLLENLSENFSKPGPTAMVLPENAQEPLSVSGASFPASASFTSNPVSALTNVNNPVARAFNQKNPVPTPPAKTEINAASQAPVAKSGTDAAAQLPASRTGINPAAAQAPVSRAEIPSSQFQPGLFASVENAQQVVAPLVGSILARSMVSVPDGGLAAFPAMINSAGLLGTGSITQRPAASNWSEALPALQANPGVVSRQLMTADPARVPAELSAGPRLRMTWHSRIAPASQSLPQTLSADPVSLAYAEPATFAPALARTLATLSVNPAQAGRVELPTSATLPMSPESPARLPGTGLVDRSQAAPGAGFSLGEAGPSPVQRVDALSFATPIPADINGSTLTTGMARSVDKPESAYMAPVSPPTALARALERADTNETVSRFDDYGAWATGPDFTYARPGQPRPVGPSGESEQLESARSAEISPSSFSFETARPVFSPLTQTNSARPAPVNPTAVNQVENNVTSGPISRYFQPEAVARETVARFSQFTNPLGSANNWPGMGFAQAARFQADALPVGAAPTSWAAHLPALRLNPGTIFPATAATGYIARSSYDAAEAESLSGQANSGETLRPVARTLRTNPIQPGTTGLPEASEAAFEPASMAQMVARTLEALTGPREVGDRLSSRLAQFESADPRPGFARFSPLNPVGASFNSARTGSAATGLRPNSTGEGATTSPIERLYDRLNAVQSGANLSEARTDSVYFNYAVPVMTGRKAGDYAPATYNDNSSNTSGAAPVARAMDEQTFLQAGFAISRDFALPLPSGPVRGDSNSSWQNIPLNYSSGPVTTRASRLNEGFAQPGESASAVLPGLNLTTQNRRIQSNLPGNEAAYPVQRLPLAMPQPAANNLTGLAQAVSEPAILGGETDFGRLMMPLTTHFEAPEVRNIGVSGIPQIPMLQRKAVDGAAAPTGVARSFDTLMRTSVGRSLDNAVQNRMNNIFGTKFEQVKVHTDSPAAEYTRQIGAEAFTVGPSIFFAPGRYQPETASGQALIGHELTHVIQQANLPSLGGGRIPETSTTGQTLEREAQGNERLLLQHLTSSHSESGLRPGGETQLGLVSSTYPGFNPSSSPVQRAYNPVDSVHLRPEISRQEIETTVAREMSQDNGTGTNLTFQPLQSLVATNEPNENPQMSIEEISERVYRLLKNRLIIERERGGSSGGRFF